MQAADSARNAAVERYRWGRSSRCEMSPLIKSCPIDFARGGHCPKSTIGQLPLTIGRSDAAGLPLLLLVVQRAPAVRADLPVNHRATARRLKIQAVAAFLPILRRILIFHR